MSLSHVPHSIVDAMTPLIAPSANTDIGNKIYHLEARIESVEDAPGSDPQAVSESRLTATNDSVREDNTQQKMQVWWEEATRKDLNVSDTYSKVAVLIIKWADELDDLETRAEVCVDNVIFRGFPH